MRFSATMTPEKIWLDGVRKSRDTAGCKQISILFKET